MLLFIIAIVAIVAMAAIVALALLYPEGVLQNQVLKYVTVTASGTSYGYPQSAVLYASMNGTGPSSAIATSNLSLTVNKFNYTVSGYIGGNSSRISTQSYSLRRVWNSSYYEATESVTVSLPQVQNATPLLNALSLIPDVYINQVAASLTDQQVAQLTQNALSQALRNATSQATVLAANKTVTVRNITVSRSYIYPYPIYSSGVASAQNQGSIFFNGRQGVQEQVTVVYSYS